MTTSQADDISLEILEPHLIVLPLPEKRANASIFVQIRILLSNKTTTPFPFLEGILTPELSGADDQPLQPQQLIDTQATTSQSKRLLIPYNSGVMPTFLIKLFWQNDLLQFQATIFDAPKVPINPNYCWSFNSLQAGTYQLRFTYNSPTRELLYLDWHDDNLKTDKVVQRETLVTPWTTLRLVEPVEADKKAVEVDGIRFETLVSDKIIQVPLTTTNVNIPIEIGLKITNNTSTPYRFIMFDSLIPELMGAEGLIPGQETGGSAGWLSPIESDFYLAMSGESVSLFPKVHLVQQADGLWQLLVPGRARSCWLFNDLKLGTYQIQLTYRSLTIGDLFEDEWINFPKDAWMGKVYTPFVEFHLVQS